MYIARSVIRNGIECAVESSPVDARGLQGVAQKHLARDECSPCAQGRTNGRDLRAEDSTTSCSVMCAVALRYVRTDSGSSTTKIFSSAAVISALRRASTSAAASRAAASGSSDNAAEPELPASPPPKEVPLSPLNRCVREERAVCRGETLCRGSAPTHRRKVVSVLAICDYMRAPATQILVRSPEVWTRRLE